MCRTGEYGALDTHVEAKIARWVYRLGKGFVRPGTDVKLRELRNILLIRTDALGDMVVSSAFFRELRRNCPKAHITLICAPVMRNLVERCPYIDEILCFDKRYPKHNFLHNLKATNRFARKYLRARRYDLAIYMQHLAMTTYPEAWLAFFSGAGRRMTWSETVDRDKHDCYEGANDLFYTDLLDDERWPRTHEVDSMLAFLEYLQMPIKDRSLELWTDEQDEQFVDELFRRAGIDAGKMKIVVNLSTSYLPRDWPVDRYLVVCRRIREEYAPEFVLVGAGKTAAQYSQVFCSSFPNVLDLTNQTTLRQTCAAMKRCDFYLGGDTGPLHIAAACGLDGVGIYHQALNHKGPAYNPSVWFAPWQCNIKVLRPEHPLPGCEEGCVSDQPHCILQITADQVYESMKNAIESRRRKVGN